MSANPTVWPIKEAVLDWSISSVYRDNFDIYNLLHWDRSYFMHKSVGGIIGHEGVIFQINYYKCDPRDLYKYRDVILSFRRVKGFDRGWVLVRPKFGTEIV